MGKGRKGKKKGGTGRNVVTVVNPTEAMERRLASSQDAVHYVGKLLIQQDTISGVQTISTLAPSSSLGPRAAALASIFANFKYKEIVLEFLWASSTTGTGLAAVGFLDDATSEGDAPISIGGVTELRCSGINYGQATTPTSVLWKPTDKAWKYTYIASVSDPRFTNPYGIYYGSNNVGVISGSYTFSMVFKGAVDIGSALPDYVDIPRMAPSTVGGSLRRTR